LEETGEEEGDEDLTDVPKVDEIRRTLVVEGTVPMVRLLAESGMRLRFTGRPSVDKGSALLLLSEGGYGRVTLEELRLSRSL
jgi:hypothetical protein